MQQVRLIEQRKAAYVGEYSFMAQLGYPSEEVKEQRNGPVVEDIKFILSNRYSELFLGFVCQAHNLVASFQIRSDQSTEISVNDLATLRCANFQLRSFCLLFLQFN